MDKHEPYKTVQSTWTPEEQNPKKEGTIERITTDLQAAVAMAENPITVPAKPLSDSEVMRQLAKDTRTIKHIFQTAIIVFILYLVVHSITAVHRDTSRGYEDSLYTGAGDKVPTEVILKRIEENTR